MFYKKQGFPEISDIVICTVKKVLYHSVFVILDEYENKEGMIHISEIAPGRIRNIRDYVKEDKKIVCKVLNINQEKGHIDLSLRRVNNSERINKNDEYKQEQKSEKLLTALGKKLDKDIKSMYEFLGDRLIEEYESLNNAFQNFAIDNSLIEELKLPKKTEELLTETINEKIKIPEVDIIATITIQSNAPNGVEIIKDILSKIGTENTKITYISAPKYRLTLKAPDYKSAESELKTLKEKFLGLVKTNNCIGEISRK